MKTLKNKSFQKQCGAVLVMSLLMLFVLTLIGVSSMSTTTLEEKMSGNARDRHLAFQSAETAISDAERFIQLSIVNPTIEFSNNGVGGLYTLGNGPSSSDAVDKAWWGGANTKPYLSTTQDVNTTPQYTIEYIGETQQEEVSDVEIQGGEGGTGGQGSIFTFRITARGTGLTDNSVVVIQSHFGKRI